MSLKNTTGLIIGWSLLTILAVAVAVVRIIKHTPYQISLIIAVLMLILLTYLFILRKIDGPSFSNSANDERLWQISVIAQRNSFWFLFISLWCLAVIIEFFDPIILHEYIGIVLAGIGTIALFIYMLCFLWQKYWVSN